MSSDGKPFDPLGRILREGGDVALANAMSRGNQRQEILLLKKWRDWGASDSDISTVRGIAEQAVDAGRQLTEMDPNAEINFSIIPVNPLLFGDKGEGLRFYASTDYQLSSTGLWYRADFLMPDLYSPSDIITEMAGEAERRVDDSPQVFNDKAGNEVTIIGFAIQVIIGKF